MREVVATAEPFDPARSRRRFTLGAPDALASFVLPHCLAAIRKDAPGIELAVVNLFPNMMLAALDAKQIDLALAPLEEIPPRFGSRPLFVEEFVIAGRRGHPFFAKPTLARYCAMQHIVVSLSGDPFGLVDIALAEKGLSRSVVLTVPSHVLALSIIAETDLLAATPRSLVTTQADRYRLASADSPVRLPASPINAVAPVAALRDAGLAWLMDTLERAIRTHAPARRRPRAR